MISPADVVTIQNGINEGLTLFYTIGGTILVVLAAIWGFQKITALLDSGTSEQSSGCGREGHDEQDVHSRYIDRYGMDAYNKRFNS